MSSVIFYPVQAWRLLEPGVAAGSCAEGVSELSQEAKSPRSSFYVAEMGWDRSFFDLMVSLSIPVDPFGVLESLDFTLHESKVMDLSHSHLAESKHSGSKSGNHPERPDRNTHEDHLKRVDRALRDPWLGWMAALLYETQHVKENT